MDICILLVKTSYNSVLFLTIPLYVKCNPPVEFFLEP